mgnify:CR=1 FL=1
MPFFELSDYVGLVRLALLALTTGEQRLHEQFDLVTWRDLTSQFSPGAQLLLQECKCFRRRSFVIACCFSHGEFLWH